VARVVARGAVDVHKNAFESSGFDTVAFMPMPVCCVLV